jgi:uncharacterized protein YjbI with pentapeptide repeats
MSNIQRHAKVSPPSGKDEDLKEKGFFNRPRRGGKTPWDWLNLLAALAIPLVVVLATIGFGWWQGQLADMQHQKDQQSANLQHTRDQQSVLDQQRATILQTYIDNIQDLLLNHNLLKAKPTDDVAILARARTLTALQGLDAQRKATVVQFLYEAHLIGYYDSSNGFIKNIFSLSGADLTGTVLPGTVLPGVVLRGADLSGAMLSGAHLNGADLTGAVLTGAVLTGAVLSGAYLNGADLSGAHLDNTDLSAADLSCTNLSGGKKVCANLKGAIGTTPEQLAQAKSLQGATMPDGSTHP